MFYRQQSSALPKRLLEITLLLYASRFPGGTCHIESIDYERLLTMIEKALSVEGWMTESELAFPYAIGSKMPEGAQVVEVGSWRGRSTVAICEALQKKSGASLVAVDTFEGDPHIEQLEASKDLQQDGVYKAFCANTAAYPFRSIMRTTSLEAVNRFQDGTLDWVFINAFHEYSAVLADIEAWYPKLKPGGLLSGHDYGYLGINRALRLVFAHVCAWDTIWYTRHNGQPLRRRPIPAVEFALRRTLRGEKL